MLFLDEDVGHSSLSSLLLKSLLDCITVGHLIKLENLELISLCLEGLFGSVAVGAPRLGEHHDLVALDFLIDSLGCVRHFCEGV